MKRMKRIDFELRSPMDVVRFGRRSSTGFIFLLLFVSLAIGIGLIYFVLNLNAGSANGGTPTPKPIDDVPTDDITNGNNGPIVVVSEEESSGGISTATILIIVMAVGAVVLGSWYAFRNRYLGQSMILEREELFEKEKVAEKKIRSRAKELVGTIRKKIKRPESKSKSSTEHHEFHALEAIRKT